MQTLFDFSPLFRSTVGFDRLTRALDTALRQEPQGYPPYNIEKLGDNEYRVTLAVAGFQRDDLDIQLADNVLTVTGKQKPEAEDGRKVLHRGLAARAFQRSFSLAEHIKVVNASLADGLLNVDLVREIPEAQKPRKIEIGTGSVAQIEEKQAA